MGVLITPQEYEPGYIMQWPWLASPMQFPSFIGYGVYTIGKQNDNAAYLNRGAQYLQESAFGGATAANRHLIQKIPGAGLLKANGANQANADNMTKSQVRAAAEQSNVTKCYMNQVQEGDYAITSASNQACWYNERVKEKQDEYFPGQNPINGGEYGDQAMGQPDFLHSGNAIAQNGTLANQAAARAGLDFFSKTFTANDSTTKMLADVHSGYNCRMYPTTPLGGEQWIHRMLYMMQRYKVAGWGTKWHVLFPWPFYESTGSNVAHSGWPYAFNLTNPAGVFRSYGHLPMEENFAMAVGYLWCQALDGVTNRAILPWSNSQGYTTDINKQSKGGPPVKPNDEWLPAPGSPSSFPYISSGQLSYPQEPQYAYDAIDQGMRMWYRSYVAMGSTEGTKAFASFSLNTGSTWTDPHPGGVHSILHGLANRYGIAQTEATGSKIKWSWCNPFATPGVKYVVRLKHVATGKIHDATVIGNKNYSYVEDL
jgi:hypothetical protein